jgi:hypothetical protein
MRTVASFVWPSMVSGVTKHIVDDAQADGKQYSWDAILHENGQHTGMIGGLRQPPKTTPQCNGW